MNENPWQSPFGPHGPQLDVPSTTPNPTAQEPFSGFPASDAGTAAPAAAPVWSGGGGTGGGGPMLTGRSGSMTPSMRKLAIAGFIVGGLVGAVRGYYTHLPVPVLATQVVRYGVGTAALGASVLPAFRVMGALLGALIWVVVVLLLWAIALAAFGPAVWPPQFR